MLDFCSDSVNPYAIHCVYADGSTAPSKAGYPERFTRWFELEYIISGGGHVVMNGETYPAEAGRIFIRPPGTRNQGFLPYESYLLLFDLQFDPEKLESYRDPQRLNRPPSSLAAEQARPLSLEAEDPSYARELFRSCYLHFSEQTAGGRLRVKADILSLLAYLNDCLEAKKSLGRTIRLHKSAVMALKKEMDEDPGKAYSLEMLAAQCGFSQGFLCRVFKQVTGQTVFQYLAESRLRMAKTLLIDTNLPIKDICRQCGFQNESYFYHTFREKLAVSPVRFREMHRY